jgi:hypothetical protein
VASKYKRILLKLSGEALMGDQGFGICPNMLTYVAEEVRSIVELDVQLAIVVGGGNIFAVWRPVRLVWSGRRPITWGCWQRYSTAWPFRMHWRKKAFRPGCRRPFPCTRWPNRTSFDVPCGIWKKVGWLFLPPGRESLFYHRYGGGPACQGNSC